MTKHLYKNIPTLLILVFIGFSASCKAQSGRYSTMDKKAEALFEEGFKLERNGDYAGAQKALTKAVEKDPNFREAYMLLGRVDAALTKYDEAISAFQRAYQIDPQASKMALYYMAELERETAQYKSAQKHYQELLKYDIDPETKTRVYRNMDRVYALDSLVKNPIGFNPQNLGPEVNTPAGEYAPTLRTDGSALIFTRRDVFPNRDPDFRTDSRGQTEEFFITKKQGGNWTKAINMGPPLNTGRNEGSQTISADGQTMFFAASGRIINGRVYNSLDIYWAKKKGDNWDVPQNIGGAINTGAWETQPSISSDGKTLYFISDRPGGYGKNDIYTSTLQDNGTWSIPVNLGPSINTPGEEYSPFIHPDNQTLYFASDYWPGFGNFDLFYSRKNAQGKFQKPINMGMPLNTKDDEYSMIVSADGKSGFFASTTLKGYGDYDLYSFEIPESARPVQVTYMKGIVSELGTKKLLEATFELIDLKTGEIIVKSTSDPVSGEFIVSIPANHDYALNVSKDGYLFHSENFSLLESKNVNEPFVKNVELTPIIIDKPIVLRNIFFETGSAELKSQSTVELNKLVELLTKNKTMKIEISGHTDNVGSKESNIILSNNRSKSVADYLISKGIAADRLTTKGYGDTKPIDDNGTEQGRANNRRTEFKVTSI